MEESVGEQSEQVHNILKSMYNSILTTDNITHITQNKLTIESWQAQSQIE